MSSAVEQELIPEAKKTIPRGWIFAGIIVVWAILGKIMNGKYTLAVNLADQTKMSASINDWANHLGQNRQSNPFFVYFITPVREFISGLVDFIRSVISVPLAHSSIPMLGWLGIFAVIGFIVFITSNFRQSLFAMATIFSVGALGLWTQSMDSLALVLTAAILSLLIGIPVGIWAGLSDRGLAVVTPILDLAQILPTLVYLAPVALFFLIGPAAATIATMIYTIPISIRLTAFGIRGVPKSPVEASVSMGTTKWQLLRHVQLPMASRTIVLGINQTTLAALSFAVIATLIGAPGLGDPVVQALVLRNVGDGAVAGLAVVLIAIMFDRSTSATLKKQGIYVPPSEKAIRNRRIGIGIFGAITVAAIVVSRQFKWAAFFPESINVSKPIADFADKFTSGAVDHFGFATTGLNTLITETILNPLESLLTGTPWFITSLAIVAISFLLGGARSAIVTTILLLAIVSTGLWQDTMVTFTQTIVATLLTMIIGVILGVWIGRSERADKVLRPFLDAGQVLPAFVYLIPMLGFFGPSRFTGIATGIIYSIPIVVKIVGQGIREVPVNMNEAAISAGSTKWQQITKVQLPAAKNSLLLATNQGLIFVLAVIVIGGFVGSGGLGYLVLVGQSKVEMTGKGLVAGLAILLLGVMIDRIAQYTVRRNSAPKQ